MRLLVWMAVFLVISPGVFSQAVSQKLASAVNRLLKEPQMKHAIMSLYVTDQATGNVVYDYNSEMGLTPASTQKIFTAVAALDLLDVDYRYKTTLSYTGNIQNKTLNGDIWITGSGDPSLGSWRYGSTKPEIVFQKFLSALKNKGIESVKGNIVFDNRRFSYQSLPGGWIWDDIGNYYGAGSWAFNWHENQYDLLLKPGKREGDPVEITGTKPSLEQIAFINYLKTGKPKSGDQAYIYMPPNSSEGLVEGTVPAGEGTFKISGSVPNPADLFGRELQRFLVANNVQFSGGVHTINAGEVNPSSKYTPVLVENISSPPLDSIVYWFMQKSLNLYGEALVKTFAVEASGYGTTDKGVEWLKQYWMKNGIESSALNIKDGSGLSPQNRVTSRSLVQALQYAKSQPWFPAFYKSIPVYNNLKMKSGTIGGVKSFAGYCNANNGRAYTFAIIINNFDGSASSIVQKMYKVLNELK